MAAILCKLTRILCCDAHCSPQEVAGMMAFHPPDPASYTLTCNNIRDGSQCTFTYSNGRVLDRIVAPNVVFEARLAKRLSSQKNHANNDVPCLVFKTTTGNEAPVILFAHGNAVDLGGMAYFLAHLCALCQVHVVAFEYSGYGQTLGIEKPSATNMVQDALTAHAMVTTLFPRNPLILYGESLGSVPITKLCTMKNINVAGVILHSPLASGLGLFIERPIILKLLCCFNVFTNSSTIKKTCAPVFVMHGRLDEEIPFRHAVEIYEAIPAALAHEPFWVDKGGHNDLDDVAGDEFWIRIRNFVDQFRVVRVQRQADDDRLIVV